LQSVGTPKGKFGGGEFLITIPQTYLTPLLREARPDYAEALARVPYFGAVCTILELSRPLSHIYWMNVADPGFPFGGIIEHTNLIPASEYGGRHIVYLSRYFAPSDPLARMSTEEIAAVMVPPLKRVFPDFKDADILKTSVFRTLTAAPVCGLNFSRQVPACRSPIKHLYIANMCHIYPDERSCNNSIRLAAEACRVVGIDTKEVPRGASLAGKIGLD
jgi:protoporphyrinogen oxidase